MRRVLLHLGFHKTGTTAAQSFLFENRSLIWPHHALVLPYRTRHSGLSDAATRYSLYGTPGALEDFRDQMRRFLKSLTFGRKRGLVLSEENFSGLRPSRNPAVGYETAPALATCLVDLVRERFKREEVQITLYLSVRQRESWLRSLWAHDLQRTRLVLDFGTFRDRMAPVAEPQSVAEEIRGRLPSVLVRNQWLEDLQTRPFGPGTPFADFLDLPEAEAAKLVGPTRRNSGLPDGLLAQMLDMNRSALDDAALIEQKAALVEHAQTELIGTT